MNQYSREDDGWPSLVKIPAEVERDDTILGPLTARQSIQLGVLMAALWLGYQATKQFVPPLFYLAAAVPIGTAGTIAVLTRREGLTLDRWLLAAWRHSRSPRRLVPAADSCDGPFPWQAAAQREQPATPPAELRLPIADVGPDGVIDAAGAGRVVLSRAGTVNFGLRTAGEQQALIAGFARWLNALTGPVQILVRSQRLEIGPAIAELEQAAGSLPHPLLEEACREHADFLAELAAEQELLSRQVLVVHREPGCDRAAGMRAQRRAEEAVGLLAAAEVPLRPLSGAEAFAQVAAATAPDTPVHPDPALPNSPVTLISDGGAL
ncbi:PrgI family protein [Kitasatospora sp. NBC_01266]|uniref:PrgI family protein n=1 Tax=Kitasatospora sp. NBC_01266 TaxID=2903572 RepID=UPI002E36C531|nr:PrgI family protein [Kitasatospora sp. NBC_01266]